MSIGPNRIATAMMLSVLPIAASAVLASFAAAQEAGGVTVSDDGERRVCTVLAQGDELNDVPNIAKAFQECDHDATVVFPEDQTYWIEEKLHVTLQNVDIEWRGQWLVRRRLRCLVLNFPPQLLGPSANVVRPLSLL